MERRYAVTGESRLLILLSVFLLTSTLQAKESDPLFRPWAERQEQGDFTGAMKALLVVLKERPGDSGAIQRMGQTTRAIEKQAQTIDRLASEDRNAIVARAVQSVRRRDRETREAMNNLRASYEHNWKTTPEALLHTCRGTDLQLQITLPDDEAGRRMKDYLSSLCLSLTAETKRGGLPTDANVHRVAGFLAYQRLELDDALSEWGKAKGLAPDDTALADFIRRTEDTRAREKRRARASEKTGLANQRLAAGETKSALALFKEAVELDPGNAYAADQVGRLTRLLGKEARRAELGRHRGRAMALEAEGRLADAVREWLAVLEVDPMNTEARERVETLAAQRPAVPTPSKPSATVRDPERAASFYSQGLLLYAEDDLPGARKAFEQCVALDPSHTLARRAIDRISLQLSQKQ